MNGEGIMVNDLSIIGAKPDPKVLAAAILETPAILSGLIDFVNTDQRSRKFACTKAIRFVSEQKPDLIYTCFDDIARWLDHKNVFVKWDAIQILANLSAANVIGSAWKIAVGRPCLENILTRRLLGIEKIVYEYHGEPSPECSRVICGYVLDYFEKIFPQTSHQSAILDFATRQSGSSRESLAKKALAFLRKYRTRTRL
jgi:hypothetical protein